MLLDPRSKMIMVICISSLALIYNTPARLLQLLLVTLVLLFIFSFNLRVIAGYLKPFVFLMFFLFVVQSIFSPGDRVILALGPVSLISIEGVLAGATVVLRLLVITAAAMLFTTFSSRDFILGLVQWKVPYEIAFMVSTALRFLPLFRDELKNVLTAIQLRGVDLKKVPWGKKMVMYRRLTFPVVYRNMLKAEQLAIAMEARAFRAYPQRTYLRQLNLQRVDYVVILLSLLVTFILIMRYIG
ncbi:energy-coupling factor transporter transmembrane component T family protein [Syntrophomonas wolfei]|uniref:energy-coupling factor transporter transmembrane component T family protein n=1 Tax=Syntrophomonas wolfei TaxID=863 RepID=UPI000773CA83|nr:energy-coupling factor transporter transmembrane component T [Syntrophomonas wolfei]